MNMLYIADNGFSCHNNKFFCTTPNKHNIAQYQKYFDKIHIIARESPYKNDMFELSADSKVILIKRNNFFSLYMGMKSLREDYDIVLLRNGINGCIASIFLKLIKKTSIAYCGSDPYVFQRKSNDFFRSNILSRVWKWLEQKKMSTSNYAQYCTKYLYNKYPTSHPYLICSNVDVVINEANYIDRIKKIDSNPNIIKIGMLGRLDDNKGIKTIIKALSRLDKNYTFECWGSGNISPFLPDIIQSGVRDRFHSYGYCSDKLHLNHWLKTIDIYIQPSLSEGLPRSTIEAMSMACPCIATNVGGLPDLLNDKYLIVPGDDAALADKIMMLANNKAIAKEAARANFQKAKEYSFEIRDHNLDIFFGKIITSLK